MREFVKRKRRKEARKPTRLIWLIRSIIQPYVDRRSFDGKDELFRRVLGGYRRGFLSGVIVAVAAVFVISAAFDGIGYGIKKFVTTQTEAKEVKEVVCFRQDRESGYVLVRLNQKDGTFACPDALFEIKPAFGTKNTFKITKTALIQPTR